jgi:hypothetical protein
MPRNEDRNEVRNEVRKAPEYIEREALIEEINSLQVSVTGLRVGKSVLGEYIKHYKDSIIKIINEQPDADVAEIKHGKWINTYIDYSTAECSCCSEQFEVNEKSNSDLFNAFKQFYKYYPNCGAKMDKE